MLAVCSWDSSIHDSVHLNRVTSPNERIYLIIKATVQLSHPASMELVLRKRIAVNIYNKQVHTGRVEDSLPSVEEASAADGMFFIDQRGCDSLSCRVLLRASREEWP